ncbi:transcription factor bHLH112-like [Prosopis cineraria]|uniref:transcription factor bHLH112-like n=1 Tax=Prosopis cineraria TaxID=364024 RepID=UPI00240FEBBE|nr:transcription factor bHLH112-like [Prosopis cineraria]
MAEEFEAAGICGGNWWNMSTCSSRSVLFPLITSSPSSSLCSIAANSDGGNFSCTWQTDSLVDLKSPLASVHHHHHDSLGFLVQQEQNQNESPSAAATTENNGNIMMDSTLGFASTTSSNNWNNHSLLGRPERNFHSVLEEEAGGVDSSNSEMIQKDWSPSKGQVSSIKDAFKPMNQEFAIDQQNNLSCASYGYGLYDNDDDDEHNNRLHHHHHLQPQPQPEDSLFTNPSVAYNSYNNNPSNEVSPCNWSKVSEHFLKQPSMPKQQLGGLHFSNNNNNNNSPFWNNASAEALDDVPAPHVFVSSQQSQTFEQHKPICSALLTKHKREEAPVCEPAAFKRPRIETPSPLPTFKVRKEKLGDRITALQQLVSPFGKTDTASVLHEAIECIKYLHDQVSVLSASYLDNGPPVQHYQRCDEKESKGTKQDLRSHGLCLAPISSTFSLANYEMMASELWTHAYGGALMR